ncbi:MAG: hypothetical protein Ct9H90mP20_4710 [Candidatus Neomarinimicrobiota bacterium]|nr:MAG: hypothetical protein Ct9H90mP20_4710 [Candidatus Neomarinimicrobiota bacterium]
MIKKMHVFLLCSLVPIYTQQLLNRSEKSQLNESYLILVFMVILILEQQMIEAYIIGIFKPAQ